MFKPNQKVKCVRGHSLDAGGFSLTRGRIYTVKSASNGYVELFENTGPSAKTEWCLNRFVTYSPAAAKAAARDSRGRFVSATNAPTQLRRGSLYSVKRKRGPVTARYRNATINNYGVFDIHGKPFLARLSKVALANKEAVTTYLAAESK